MPSLQILFPCRPNSLTRELQAAAFTGTMQVTSCSAGGLTFGLARIDAGDGARIGPLMQASRDALASNLSAAGRIEAAGVVRVGGMTPHPDAGRFRVSGSAPDGGRLSAHAMLFVHRNVVYQATVLGPAPEREVVDLFFESIRLVE